MCYECWVLQCEKDPEFAVCVDDLCKIFDITENQVPTQSDDECTYDEEECLCEVDLAALAEKVGFKFRPPIWENGVDLEGCAILWREALQ